MLVPISVFDDGAGGENDSTSDGSTSDPGFAIESGTNLGVGVIVDVRGESIDGTEPSHTRVRGGERCGCYSGLP